MEEIIKREVIAYKGMNSDMTCSGFQYEIGKSYKTYKAKLCECGFHACLNPIDVLDYYSQGKNSRYFKVKLSGEITKCDSFDTNVAATEITILEEINIDEIIKTTKWWKNDNVLDLLYWSDGLARIRKGDNLYNLINKDGNFLFKKWFMYVRDFHEGFAVVERSDKQYNFINKKGKYLSDEWFEWVDNFQEGFAIVEKPIGLRNFIGKDGKIISNEWFKYVDFFQDEFASVQRTNGEWCQIDKIGNLIKNLQ